MSLLPTEADRAYSRGYVEGAKEAETLLEALGLCAPRFRTEGGLLNTQRAVAALKHPQEYAGYYRTPPAAAPTPPRDEPAAGEALRYFCFDYDQFETYPTLAEAIAAAKLALDYNRDEAGDGWPEGTDQICYGMVLGEVEQVELREARPDDGLASAITLFAEYALVPSHPAPAPSLVDAQDAARYRWLRDRADSVIDWDFMPPTPPHFLPLENGCSKTLDAAIDAALANKDKP